MGRPAASRGLMRRRTLLGAAAGACGAAALGIWRGWAPESRPAPGPVTDATLATLVAAARTVIGRPIEPAHYTEYFRWRAAHLPGYQALYERFTAEVDRDARRTAGCAFADCSAAERVRLLDAASRARAPRSGEDPRTTYDRLIFNEALALFADTDAWVALGYEGWPGSPRGLDRYRRAPR